MQVLVGEIVSYGAPILVAIVPSEFTLPGQGPKLVALIQLRRPSIPVMLVSIEDNGPRAFATFETHVLLALIQLENLKLESLNLDAALPDQNLPF